MQLILNTFLLVATVSCAFGDLCPLIYAPVCGSDGKTYASPCNLYAARTRGQPDLTIVHHGVCNSRVERAAQEDDDCPEKSKMGICTLEYAPVCASNGKTYPNKCGMCADMYAQRNSGEEVHLRVVHPGKCGSVDYCLPSDKTGACTDDYRPICGSDGKNYGNRCEFCFFKFQKLEKGEVLNMEYEGECQRCPTSSVYGKCPKIYKPVCGSDGKTYNNLCLMCFHIYSTYGFEVNDFKLKHLGAC